VGQPNVEPTVTQTDEELLGPNRVVFDNVLTQHQCQMLIDLAAVSHVIMSHTTGCNVIITTVARQ